MGNPQSPNLTARLSSPHFNHARPDFFRMGRPTASNGLKGGGVPASFLEDGGRQVKPPPSSGSKLLPCVSNVGISSHFISFTPRQVVCNTPVSASNGSSTGYSATVENPLAHFQGGGQCYVVYSSPLFIVVEESPTPFPWLDLEGCASPPTSLVRLVAYLQTQPHSFPEVMCGRPVLSPPLQQKILHVWCDALSGGRWPWGR